MLTPNKFLITFDCLVAVFITSILIYVTLDLNAKKTPSQDIYFKQVIKNGKCYLNYIYGISNHTSVALSVFEFCPGHFYFYFQK